MNYNFGGKGIFVFTDAAGANSVLAIIDDLIDHGYKPIVDFLIYTNSKGVFPAEYSKIVKILEFDEEYFNRIITKYNPNYIFTATSFNDYEHQWRKLAIKFSIKSYAFIDHWVYYIRRFTFNNETIFADEIWVINEVARREAIKEGLPERNLVISGNPYYDKIQNFSPGESKNIFFSRYNLPLDKKIILFVSENIRTDLPKDDKGCCILGFDEYSVLEDLFDTFYLLDNNKKIDFSNYVFIIKIHPISNESKFTYLINDSKYRFLKIIVIKKIDPLLLTYYSDYIIGMFSNLLIESLLLGKKVLRIQTGQKIELFKFKKVKSELVTEKKKLENAVHKFLMA